MRTHSRSLAHGLFILALAAPAVSQASANAATSVKLASASTTGGAAGSAGSASAPQARGSVASPAKASGASNANARSKTPGSGVQPVNAGPKTTSKGFGASVLGKVPRNPVKNRDFSENPTILELDPPKRDLYTVTDNHGHYPEAIKNLLAAGLIKRKPSSPSKVEWAGGDATLIVTGDMIDKDLHVTGEGADGPTFSTDVIDLYRTLQQEAAAKGGKVIVIHGNHEGEFLADPENRFSMRNAEAKLGEGFAQELIDEGGKQRPQQVADGVDPQGRGQWLRNLPTGVKVRGLGFWGHGGDTRGMTTEKLSKTYERALEKDGYSARAFMGKNSILEAEAWYGTGPTNDTAKQYAAALGVPAIFFGHNPHKFDTWTGKKIIPQGKHGMIATDDGVLFGMDAGMADGRPGRVLHLQYNEKSGKWTPWSIKGNGKREKFDFKEKDLWREGGVPWE
jgi:hypothetical protein